MVKKKKTYYLKTWSLTTNEYKLVMYEYETKTINPNYRPKSQTRTEKEKLGREDKNIIENWEWKKDTNWKINCAGTIK